MIELAGPGSLLCLMTIPFGVINSFWHAIAKRRHPRRGLYHLINLGMAAFFFLLAIWGAGTPAANSTPLILARLWLPIFYYWWAYTWAGKTLHVLYDPEFSFDRPIIALEQRWFGNPSAWMALDKPAWLNEINNFFYWSYYLYAPTLAVALWSRQDWQNFEAMAMAVNVGYMISYGLYPLYPLWGPRWALFSEGLLPKSAQILDGYLFTAFMNRIMWSDTPHKGGAMPSAHSSTCVVFMIWCARVWGTEGMLIGGGIGLAMFVSTVYGRYHYVIDVFVGVAIGLLSVWLADLLVLAA